MTDATTIPPTTNKTELKGVTDRIAFWASSVGTILFLPAAFLILAFPLVFLGFDFESLSRNLTTTLGQVIFQAITSYQFSSLHDNYLNFMATMVVTAILLTLSHLFRRSAAAAVIVSFIVWLPLLWTTPIVEQHTSFVPVWPARTCIFLSFYQQCYGYSNGYGLQFNEIFFIYWLIVVAMYFLRKKFKKENHITGAIAGLSIMLMLILAPWIRGFLPFLFLPYFPLALPVLYIGWLLWAYKGHWKAQVASVVSVVVVSGMIGLWVRSTHAYIPPPSETANCVDTDPTNDVNIKGVVTYTDKYGKQQTAKDECFPNEGGNQITQPDCYSGYGNAVIISYANNTKTCPSGLCRKGICVDSSGQ